MQGCIKDFFPPRGWAAPGGNSSGNDAVASLPLERMLRKGLGSQITWQYKIPEALGRDDGDWRRNQALCPNPTCYGHLQASGNTASQKPGMQARHRAEKGASVFTAASSEGNWVGSSIEGRLGRLRRSNPYLLSQLLLPHPESAVGQSKDSPAVSEKLEGKFLRWRP